MSILATKEKRQALIDDDGHEITVGDARDYIGRYLKRIELLDYATQGKTGLGRISTEIESLGWRFHAKEFKEFIMGLPEGDTDEVVILFGVDASATPATHVIITDGKNLPKVGLHLPALSADDDDTFGYEYGSSCCSVAIDECFQSLTRKMTPEELAKATS